MRTSMLAAAVCVFLITSPLIAAPVDYPYKTVKDFKTLERSKDLDAFEAAYADYRQDCLDNTYGGTGGIPCERLGYDLWDRELNIYYERLMSVLAPPEKKVLKDSQRQWIQVRDSAINLSRTLLDRRYDTSGTLYLLMRSGDAAQIINPIVRERALMLKAMWELARQKPISKEEQ